MGRNLFVQDFCEELEYWGLDDLHMVKIKYQIQDVVIASTMITNDDLIILIIFDFMMMIMMMMIIIDALINRSLAVSTHTIEQDGFYRRQRLM